MSCVISTWMMIRFCTFAIDLMVLPVRLCLWSIILDSFSSSKVLFSLLPTLALAGFLEDFFFTLFSSSKSLLFLDNNCLSGISTTLNVGMLSKFGKAIVAFEVMFL